MTYLRINKRRNQTVTKCSSISLIPRIKIRTIFVSGTSESVHEFSCITAFPFRQPFSSIPCKRGGVTKEKGIYISFFFLSFFHFSFFSVKKSQKILLLSVLSCMWVFFSFLLEHTCLNMRRYIFSSFSSFVGDASFFTISFFYFFLLFSSFS